MCPRQRTVVGLRVRRRPAAITHGTATAAIAVRHAGTPHAAATDGAAEKRARRREEAFRIDAGRGAKKNAAGMRYATPQIEARAKQANPNQIEPMNTENAALAYRRTIGRYRVAIVIWRKHHSVHVDRSAPSNVGTRAAGTYAILSPSSRTACVSTRSSLSTSRHRSSSRNCVKRSVRIAHEPPHANDRLGSGRCGILRIVRHDDEPVPWIHLRQKSPCILVEAFIEAADRKDHGDRGHERPEGEADPSSDPAAQPDSLEDRRHAREGRQGRDERQPDPKEVQRHRRANLRVRNKPCRLRTDEDVVAFDAHLERPETGHRVREVRAGPHIVFPSVVRARADAVIEHARPYCT